jgi:hypothetical protein
MSSDELQDDGDGITGKTWVGSTCMHACRGLDAVDRPSANDIPSSNGQAFLRNANVRPSSGPAYAGTALRHPDPP